MRIFLTIVLSLTWILVGGIPAFATTLKDARVALDGGNYQLAVLKGVELGTADGLVLAAEGLNAQLLLGQAKRKTQTAKQAMKMARAALAIKPDTKDAHLQYAIAYGFYGRHVSSFTAWRKNLPKKIRIAIDAAAMAAPDDHRVHALRGAWHLNLLYKAGNFDVEKRYGANKAQGIAHFKTALADRPHDILIGATYTVLVYVLNPETTSAQTEQTLKTILAASPKNATERQLQQQMQKIYDGFATGQALRRAEAFINQ